MALLSGKRVVYSSPAMEPGLMHDFAVVPVIDLKGGLVAHARTGARAAYRPIETPLGPADNPIAIARALLAITASPALYVADLDAITGAGNHFDLCRDLADALPATSLWIDAGFSNVTDCAFWLPLGATLVIGSESLPAIGNWHELHSTYGESLVLSLDFAAEGLRGPTPILSEPAAWPNRIIAMCLDRVGTDQGPDVERLRNVVEAAGTRAVYGAGGVRRIGDLEAITAAGAKGALIATALHEGAIAQNEIAAFLQRRRSR
ncbi:MAG: HisA/HisF-related TIM barrel protein [Methyloceanibacter sp.]